MPLRLKDPIYARTNSSEVFNGNYQLDYPNKSGTVALTSDLPTVNDATLTITQNGTSAGTFSANASSNATIALTDTTYSDMTGATSSTAGTSGLVPAPSAGDQEKYLRGDGTWQPAGSSSDIPDGAVTTAKLADNAVTTAKIDGSAVTTAKIANNAVTASKIDFTSFIAGTANFPAVSAGGANDVSVNIPTQANTDYLIFLQLAGHTGYWTNLVYRPGTKTTTNFTITVYNSGSGSSGSFQIHYLVIPQ